MSRKVCYMSIDWDASYNVCAACGFVRRAWQAKPLIHKGKKARKWQRLAS